MKIIPKIYLAGFLWLFFVSGVAGSDTKPPAEGGELPSIDLDAPRLAEHQQYLGIGGKKTFTIPEIQAEVVLVEIFSMY